MTDFSKFLPRALLFLLCFFALAAGAQTTRNVGPGKAYTTIQSGMDAAVNGDTVLVAPGTYHEHIDFKGKAITVTSSSGELFTTIDGDNVYGKATVLMNSGEPATAEFSGFTVRGGGDNYSGGLISGGIFIDGGSPVIRNNFVTNNYCHAIFVDRGAPVIASNVLTETLLHPASATACSGTSVLSVADSPSATAQGGLITANIIENNSGLNAVTLTLATNVVLRNNTIRGNSSPQAGSALSLDGKGLVVVNNLILGNTSGCGGAIAFNAGSSTGTLPQLFFAQNTIDRNFATGASATSQCPLTGQISLSPNNGGTSGPSAVFLNNIISGDTPYPAMDCAQFMTPSEANQPVFRNNVLYNSGHPFFGPQCVDVSGKYNNVVADPHFAGAGTGYFQLQTGSPAIDTGDNAALDVYQQMTGQTLATDFEGMPRILNATGSGCTVDMGAFEAGSPTPCSTTMTLASSLNPSNYGQSVTFTATITSAGTPEGSLQFRDGSTALATTLVSGGVATYSTSGLSVGTHSITATYLPTGSFPSATKSIMQVVNGFAASTALTCTPSSILAKGAPATLTATVTSGSGTPLGSVAFADNGVALSTVPLFNGSAMLSYTGLTVGTHTLTATYSATGQFNSGSAASCTETVTAQPSTATLTFSPIVNTYGSATTLRVAVASVFTPNPGVPTGIVTFLNNGASIGTATVANGVATLTTSTLPGGVDNLSCRYAGDAVYAPSNCKVLPVTVAGTTTATTLTPTPNPAYFGQTVNVAVAVSAALTPVGDVTLFDGATALNRQTLDASGRTTFAVAMLAVGTHPLTARFAPANASFFASSSVVMNEVVGVSGFTVALAPTTLTVKAGATGSTAVKLGSLGIFNSPLTLSSGTLPRNATATFSAITLILPAGGAASTTFTINTQGAFPKAAATPRTPWQTPAAVLAALALVGLPFARRRNVARLLGLALLTVAMGSLSGCTDIYTVAPVVAAGTYTIPITATDPNGNTGTANLTLVVTP